MTTIPTLDLSGLHPANPTAVSGGPTVTSAPTATIEAVRAAMAGVGFLQVVGHGISPELIERAHASLALIDTLPAAQRHALLRHRSESRGIFEKQSADGRLLQRSFQFIPYDTLADAEAAGAVRGHPDYFAPNVWPDWDPGFKAIWDQYAAATRALGRTLMSLFAQALSADPTYFAEAFRHDVTLFSANWYPRQPPGLSPDDFLLEQHADSGVLTVLHQQGTYEGLQIQDRDGQWLIIAMRPEAFVINIGWLMHRWTDGRWPATIHRVIPGPSPDDCRSSVAMHFLPNIDQVVAPLAHLVGYDGPQHPPITTYDWQREFMEDYILARSDWASVKEPA